MRLRKGQIKHDRIDGSLSFVDPLVLFASFIFMLFVFSACSSSSTSSLSKLESRQNSAHPRAAAYAAEGFTMDHRSPDSRPFRAWEFYYKNCVLISRNPYPDRAEYACQDAH